MKKTIIIISMLFGFAYGQTCVPGDTVTNNNVTLITKNTARINGTVSTIVADSADGLTLVYVRVGHTDTVYSSSGPSSALRNLTGLSSGTTYRYYYKTTCPIGQANQVGVYTFTTLSATVVWTPMDAQGYQFKYVKVDSGLALNPGDTSIGRSQNTLAMIKYKSSNNTFYGYYPSCTCWRPLAIDSSGIIALLDGKVDSVTVSGDSLFYWKVGVSYGYILPALNNVWYKDGNSGTIPGTDFLGTTDGQALVFKTNNTEVARFNTSGAFGIGSGTDYGTSGYILKSLGSGSAPAWVDHGVLTTPINKISAGNATNTIDNANYTQEWDWNTHNGIFPALILNSSSTAMSGSAALLNVTLTGTNVSSSKTSTAANFSSARAGTTSTNNAAIFSATNASTNNAINVSAGNVVLNPLTASQFLTLDANKNMTSTAVASSILAASLADETGTNKAVFSDNAILVAPALGTIASGNLAAGTAYKLSSIAAMTGSNSIDNLNNQMSMTWSTFNAGNNGLALSSSSTAFGASGSAILQVTKTGTNASSGIETFSAGFGNTGAGTGSINTAASFVAYNGATNYAAKFQRGKVQFGSVGTESGLLEIAGSTSGIMTITVPAAAGSGTLTLPIVTGTIIQKAESSTASSATPSPAGDAIVNFFDVTALATGATFAAPSGTPANHNSLLIRVKDNGSPQTLAWNVIYRASTDFALPTTTVTSLTIYVQFIYNSADSKWDAVGLTQGF